MGEVIFKGLNTPGHSPDSITIDLASLKTGETIALFTGDTMFVGDVGRPDLRESEGAIQKQREELAKQLHNSIFTKLINYSDDVFLFPTHSGGSLCGKNISEEPVSTLGEEKKTNPALQRENLEDFLEYILGGQPFIPKYFSNSVEVNRQGATGYESTLENILNQNKNKEDRQVSEDEFAIEATKEIVIDIRNKKEFDTNHLRGSINIQFDVSFETWLGTLLSAKDNFYLVIGDYNLVDVVRRIASIGYEENILGVIYEEGRGFNFESPLLQEEHLNKEILEENYIVIDVRGHDEVSSSGKVFRNAIHIPLHNIPDSVTNSRFDIDIEVKDNQHIITHCSGGYRSQIASTWLRRHLNKDINVYDLGDSITRFI